MVKRVREDDDDDSVRRRPKMLQSIPFVEGQLILNGERWGRPPRQPKPRQPKRRREKKQASTDNSSTDSSVQTGGAHLGEPSSSNVQLPERRTPVPSTGAETAETSGTELGHASSSVMEMASPSDYPSTVGLSPFDSFTPFTNAETPVYTPSTVYSSGYAYGDSATPAALCDSEGGEFPKPSSDCQNQYDDPTFSALRSLDVPYESMNVTLPQWHEVVEAMQALPVIEEEVTTPAEDDLWPFQNWPSQNPITILDDLPTDEVVGTMQALPVIEEEPVFPVETGLGPYRNPSDDLPPYRNSIAILNDLPTDEELESSRYFFAFYGLD